MNRPPYGLSEAAQTFETAVPFLQTFCKNQLLGSGMEQLRKVLASKLDVWALLNTYFPGAASIEEELKPAVKSFMSMMESLSQDDTVPELIMSLFQCGAMMLYLERH